MADHDASIARVDPVLIELCRLRMGTILGCEFAMSYRYGPAMAAGLDEAKIALIHRYPDNPLFTPRERAGIEFAEQFAMQSSSISDDDVARLLEHIDAESFIYFVKALSVTDQLLRGTAAFGIAASAEVPEALGKFVPAQGLASAQVEAA
ncbi:MAG: carboxymuconolactone decarboxylase family protein [Novosphingobium sp.]